MRPETMFIQKSSAIENKKLIEILTRRSTLLKRQHRNPLLNILYTPITRFIIAYQVVTLILCTVDAQAMAITNEIITTTIILAILQKKY